MPDSALSSARLLAAAALLAAVVIVSILPVDIGDTPVANAIWDAGHFPLFGVLALGLWVGFSRRGTGGYVTAGLVGLAAAASIELVQPFFGRTASLGDLGRGALGVVVTLVGVRAWRSGSTLARVVHGVVTFAIVGALLLPAWEGWRAMRWRSAHYPLLAGFEDAIEMRLWFSQGGPTDDPTAAWRSRDWAASGDHSLKVRKSSGGWPGVSYRGGLMDWSGYATLSFELYNPGEAFRLRLRIDDADTRDSRTSFAMDVPVAPGRSRIAVPIDEIARGPREGPLDRSRIKRFLLYTGPDDPPRVFFLDELRLLPGP